MNAPITRFAIVPLPEGFNKWPPKAIITWLGLFSYFHWEDEKPASHGCFPSQKELHERTGYGLRTVRSGLAFLKDEGYLTWDYDKHSKRRSYSFPVLEGYPCPFPMDIGHGARP